MIDDSQQHEIKVSYLLMAYNSERFIREAVLSAFTQESCVLELIISDDCSTDRTYDIIRQLVDEYQGPHRIILNRNERNEGIGNHVNRMMEMATGELIIIATGDDISLPERSREIISQYQVEDAHYICSDVFIIDKHSNVTGERLGGYDNRGIPFDISTCFRGLFGASAAWKKELFQIFGGLKEGSISEDRAIQFRASLTGKITHINKKLVKYRMHDTNVTTRQMKSFTAYSKQEILACRMRVNIYENFLKDMAVACDRNLIYADYSALIKEMLAQWQTVLNIRTGRKRELMRLVKNIYRREKWLRWEMMYILLSLLFPRIHYLYKKWSGNNSPSNNL